MEVWFVVTGQVVFVARVVVGVVLGELGTLLAVLFLYMVLPGWLGPVPAAAIVLGVVVITVHILRSDSAWHTGKYVKVGRRRCSDEWNCQSVLKSEMSRSRVGTKEGWVQIRGDICTCHNPGVFRVLLFLTKSR
jgi:hypothetical protein